MSEIEDTLDPGTAAEQSIDAVSVLDKIKKRRDERDDETVVSIPSWGDELKAKYRVIDRAEVDLMIRNIRIRTARQGKNGNADTTGSEADADFLIKSCIGVIAYDLETGTEVTVGSGFNMAFASMLGDPDPESQSTILIRDGDEIVARVSRPAELVAYLLKGNSIALASHAQSIARWMRDTSKPIEDPT